jgi:phosphatidylserine decarboxylase
VRQTLFYNRYTKAVESEDIPLGILMSLACKTTIGKLTTAALLKRKIFALILGAWASRSRSRARIDPFIEKFRLKRDSFEKKSEEFVSFNDFFYRKLKPSARPIAPQLNVIVSPADGRHLAYNDMENFSPFFIKGESISVEELIVDKHVAHKFTNGSILISRLCPTDYHRFHFPVSCVPAKTFLIKGQYKSVHPTAMAGRMETFLKNKRMSTVLHTETCGDILMVEIGAMGIGTIRQTFSPGKSALKGDEKGYFEIGGSTVILIFENGRIKFSEDILEKTSGGIETYILMGDEIATF